MKKISALFADIPSFLERATKPLIQSFLPQPRFLEEEQQQLEIKMADYRLAVPRMLGTGGAYLFIPTLIVFLLLNPTQNTAWLVVAGGLLAVEIVLLAQWGNAALSYKQWRFILTDKRIILITPDPDRKGFADAIYLKRGKIQVLDTNFSHSPLWGLFQSALGSRDVLLSLSGYEFQEEGAKVKGGLLFPDISAEDIAKLEDLIFG